MSDILSRPLLSHQIRGLATHILAHPLNTQIEAMCRRSLEKATLAEDDTLHVVSPAHVSTRFLLPNQTDSWNHVTLEVIEHLVDHECAVDADGNEWAVFGITLRVRHNSAYEGTPSEVLEFIEFFRSVAELGKELEPFMGEGRFMARTKAQAEEQKKLAEERVLHSTLATFAMPHRGTKKFKAIDVTGAPELDKVPRRDAPYQFDLKTKAKPLARFELHHPVLSGDPTRLVERSSTLVRIV